MERMKHTGDYELDEINMLEQECADLEEDNKRLEEENRKLKEELFNIKRNTKYNRLQDKLVFDDSKTAIEL
jgi:hypothetical protein